MHAAAASLTLSVPETAHAPKNAGKNRVATA